MSILGQIVSSKVRAEFFRLFFGLDQKELHLREIQRRSGFAVGTVRQEAENLCRLGLLIKRRDGNRTLFYANTDNPLYPDLHKLVLKTSGLVDVIRSELCEDEISVSFIFGSIAAGTSTANSDVDLFVIGAIRLRKLSSMLRRPGDILMREINPHVMTAQEFSRRLRKKEHFVSRVMASPRLMVIGEERDITALG